MHFCTLGNAHPIHHISTTPPSAHFCYPAQPTIAMLLLHLPYSINASSVVDCIYVSCTSLCIWLICCFANDNTQKNAKSCTRVSTTGSMWHVMPAPDYNKRALCSELNHSMPTYKASFLLSSAAVCALLSALSLMTQ